MQKIQNLSFDDIKSGLIASLKQEATFKSYDFEASGLNSIINILAYNTHMIGFYVRMMLSESFVDSAKLKESMLSHAKTMGYIYKGKRSARVELFVKCEVPISQVPRDMKITVPAGTRFDSTTDTGVKRSFVTIDDFHLTNAIPVKDEFNVITAYVFANEIDPVTPLVAYEGTLDKFRFIVDNSQADQRFIIKRDGVDPESIKVHVYDTDATSQYTAYSRSDTLVNIDGNSPVFYVTTSENGQYELIFGNGVFGKALQTGNIVSASFIVSSGSLGNTAGSTHQGGSTPWSDGVEPGGVASGRTIQVGTVWGNNPPDGYEVDYTPVSFGGVDEESVDDLRYNIPRAFKRQNRALVEDDYKDIILSEFRNVDSINVWGGERHFRKEYGKVFVCIKPKFSNKLSASAKKEIADSLLRNKGVVGSEVVFMDPDFVNIDMQVSLYYDKSKTDLGKGQLEQLARDAISTYSRNSMGKFDSGYSDVDLMDYIRTQISSVKSVFAHKTLFKEFQVRNTSQPDVQLTFGNAIMPGVISNTFSVNGKRVKFKDDSGTMRLANEDGSLYSSKSMGTIDYSTGDITLRFPVSLLISDEVTGKAGTMRITCTPVNPDINTYLNNIVRIASAAVTANG